MSMCCAAGAAALGRGGVQLPTLDVVRRVGILTRMGTTESILGQAAMRILTLMQRARLYLSGPTRYPA